MVSEGEFCYWFNSIKICVTRKAKEKKKRDDCVKQTRPSTRSPSQPASYCSCLHRTLTMNAAISPRSPDTSTCKRLTLLRSTLILHNFQLQFSLLAAPLPHSGVDQLISHPSHQIDESGSVRGLEGTDVNTTT